MNNTSLTLHRVGFGEAALSTLLLWAMTWFIPLYPKVWFVEASGNIQVAPFFGLLFGLLLLLRVRWAWRGAIGFTWILVALFLFSAISQPDRAGYWLLATMGLFLLYLLHSERIKAYFNPA